MMVRLYPCAWAAAAAFALSSVAQAGMLEFDLNALTVTAVDSNDQPIVPTSPNFTGKFVITKNASSAVTPVGVRYAGVTHAAITLVDISGMFTVDNGFSDGGSLSFTFANPDASITTYSYTIPVDNVRNVGDKAVQQSVNPIRFLASWDTTGDLLSSPKVSDLNFPDPLGLGYFIVHDFIPSSVPGAGYGSYDHVSLDIVVDVPDVVPEPASLLLLAAAAPVCLMRRRKA